MSWNKDFFSTFQGDFANGTMYIDDGETFSYQKGDFAYWGFTFRKESDFLYSISSKKLDPKGTLESEITIEKIVIRGARFFPAKVHVYLDGMFCFSLMFSTCTCMVIVQLIGSLVYGTFSSLQRSMLSCQM